MCESTQLPKIESTDSLESAQSSLESSLVDDSESDAPLWQGREKLKWGEVVWGGIGLHPPAVELFGDPAGGDFRVRSSNSLLPRRADIAARKAAQCGRTLHYALVLSPPGVRDAAAQAASEGIAVYACAATDSCGTITKIPKYGILRRDVAVEVISAGAVVVRDWGRATKQAPADAPEPPPLHNAEAATPVAGQAGGEWIVVDSASLAPPVPEQHSLPSTLAVVQVLKQLPGGAINGVVYHSHNPGSIPEAVGPLFDGREVVAAARFFVDIVDQQAFPVLDYIATRASCRGCGLASALLRTVADRSRELCPAHAATCPAQKPMFVIATLEPRVISFWEHRGWSRESNDQLCKHYSEYCDCTLLFPASNTTKRKSGKASKRNKQNTTEHARRCKVPCSHSKPATLCSGSLLAQNMPSPDENKSAQAEFGRIRRLVEKWLQQQDEYYESDFESEMRLGVATP